MRRMTGPAVGGMVTVGGSARILDAYDAHQDPVVVLERANGHLPERLPVGQHVLTHNRHVAVTGAAVAGHMAANRDVHAGTTAAGTQYQRQGRWSAAEQFPQSQVFDHCFELLLILRPHRGWSQPLLRRRHTERAQVPQNGFEDVRAQVQEHAPTCIPTQGLVPTAAEHGVQHAALWCQEQRTPLSGEDLASHIELQDVALGDAKLHH
mmetsp:Transcript_75596/g.162065  ORF Transcript_75596/g.162065 Transcript_75596/m.162065 type:complete len:208 (-) Transcript_75596:269-892(-)